MATGKLGTLTLGQAPRPDFTPVPAALLPPDTACVHAGVLDDLTPTEIAGRFAPEAEDAVLTTRLLSGEAVVLGKRPMAIAIQQKIDSLEEAGCDIIALLCTGEFSALRTRRAWLIEPDRLLPPTLAALIGVKRAGVLVPLAEQIASESNKWRGLQQLPVFAVASPYTASQQQLERAAIALAEQGAEVIILDCMGYTAQHRRICQQASGLPVVASSMLLASLLGNLF